ncbi:hypothetical protein [Streptomyces sp. NEAU-YJ-81]|uniref:hypothetical protein n=1 Tax=Streptomyces sp. NEAU-YJ-81 TaxID=2820288 RepID=UPI001ABC2A2A|nr:hypothetical protein [Streptomyces sp. NEAU-YJ-81]MBO3681628.1 hypothetical protein [Streptomyces sp. NEAU-YJ-81]
MTRTKVREGRAKALLTVTVSMISPVGAEYEAVLADVSAARGQLTCTGWSPPPPRKAAPPAYHMG